MAAKKRKTKSKKPRANGKAKSAWLTKSLLLLMVALLAYGLYLDVQVRSKFDGKKWSLPAKVYAEPLELYQGADLSRADVLGELKALGFRQVGRIESAGQYRLLAGGAVDIYLDDFQFPDALQPSLRLTLSFAGGRVDSLAGKAALVRLPPREIGGFYPDHKEDRLLIRLDELPALLGETLIAVEDRHFADHVGLSPRGIIRAAMANISAGRVVQGGSTLTQQLVKNFYLHSERSWLRKFNEAVMALLLELHYSKAEILEAYINEVYLGQQGQRAIHGFALASHHYFAKPLKKLTMSEVAFLVGAVKGASYYNPWRRPERAIERRNLVLAEMFEQGLISAQELAQAEADVLQVREQQMLTLQPYPAFMALVKQQLARDYNEAALRTEGLRIFTSLNPRLQDHLQQLSGRHLQRLERNKQLETDSLQTASVLVSVATGEVQALISDRRARFAGFDRAREMRRPIGSLAKPGVYLQAIKAGYSLTSSISDAAVTVQGPKGELWQPQNFDRKNHGLVPLYLALANSYNLATARLGMQLGLSEVAQVLQDLGLEKVPQVPSMLLGATEQSPLRVAQLYHTLAADGFYSPLKAIRAVQTQRGELLSRYQHRVEARVEPKYIYPIKFALAEAIATGTARSAQTQLPKGLLLAGKTGTSNDQRDSWFAGFSGERVLVSWVGRDDNKMTPLTGASGALSIWAEFMADNAGAGLATAPPRDVEFFWVDRSTDQLSGENCQNSIHLPYLLGSEPQTQASCLHRKNPMMFWWQKLWHE